MFMVGIMQLYFLEPAYCCRCASKTIADKKSDMQDKLKKAGNYIVSNRQTYIEKSVLIFF